MPGSGGTDGDGPGRQHQGVVPLAILAPRLDLAHQHLARLAIDRHRLVLYADVDPEPGPGTARGEASSSFASSWITPPT